MITAHPESRRFLPDDLSEIEARARRMIARGGARFREIELAYRVLAYVDIARSLRKPTPHTLENERVFG